jgi:peptide deformylase
LIITNNEEALRIKCDPVLLEEVGSLISTLENELSNANRFGAQGIGLAAPQIGIAKQISIIRLGKGLNIDLINAKIEKGYDPNIFKEEGCLSFPGRVEDTTRFQEVHITNNLVYPYSFVATGLLAVVCQHEIDHYHSNLFFDHKITKPLLNKPKQNPNEACFCGSGKKRKKCHQ